MAGLRRSGDVEGVSAIYESEPIGGPGQPPYLNAVALVTTALEARELLDICLAVEIERGRERRERWGARTLDLDLLLYDREEIRESGLRVPHPRLDSRRFALQPLAEVWPDAALPDGRPITDLLPGVASQQVERIEGGEWWTATGAEDG